MLRLAVNEMVLNIGMQDGGGDFQLVTSGSHKKHIFFKSQSVTWIHWQAQRCNATGGYVPGRVAVVVA